jgi:hypothetical protein
MPRKRFNAFEDFPMDPAAPAPVQTPAQAPAESPETGKKSRGLFETPHVLPQPEAPAVERIERLKPSQMMPDRFQPRRLLPTQIRPAFYSGQIDCYQAAKQWLHLAKTDAGLQAQVDRLLKMGYSFEEHGQIKPITGAWVQAPNGDYFFQIETGERRFWAACLDYVAHSQKEEPLLRVEVVAAPTRMRQVLVNRHAEPPSAVGQACEVASLILAELNMTPGGDEVDEFDFFRRARAQRMPPGLWEKIMPVMDLTRPRLVQLLNILELPTNLLDLADRYRVPERVLREVLSSPRDQWERLLVASIQKNLTADDIAELAERPRPQPRQEKREVAPPDPAQQAINALKRFANAMDTLDEDVQSAVLDEVANDLVVSDQAERMSGMLRDLAERLRIRQQNRSRRR